jgi:hypothetical protein
MLAFFCGLDGLMLKMQEYSLARRIFAVLLRCRKRDSTYRAIGRYTN